MLVFQCSDCDAKILADDHEDVDLILDRLQTHVLDCPLAQFRFDGTTDKGRKRLELLRQVLRELKPDKLRLH